MVKITPYLSVPNAKKTIEIYKMLFGANLINRQPFTPEMGKNLNLPSHFNYENSTVHADLDFNGAFLYLSDSLKSASNTPNKIKIFLELDSKEQFDATWVKVKAAHYKILIAAQKTFWGGYIGHFEDPDGIEWYLAFQEEASKSVAIPAVTPKTAGEQPIKPTKKS